MFKACRSTFCLRHNFFHFRSEKRPAFFQKRLSDLIKELNQLTNVARFEKWQLTSLTNHLDRYPLAAQSVSVINHIGYIRPLVPEILLGAEIVQ